MSDEGVLEEWRENPYWQYFTGGEFFEHELPLDSSSMTRWRKRLSQAGAEKMLDESIKTGLQEGFIKRSELKRVNVDTTSSTNWIVGAMAFHGNPYDGHTLKQAISQTSELIGVEPKMAVCALGYRGNNYQGDCDIQMVNRYRKKLPESLRHWWRRRSAIEPVIGHAKEDNRLNRNRLKGVDGDDLNVLFAGCGFNIRKLLRAIALFYALILEAIVRDGLQYIKKFVKERVREVNNLSLKVFCLS